MLHVPLLRSGVPYRSLRWRGRDTTVRVKEFVELSLANSSLIRHDLREQERWRSVLAAFRAQELFAMSKRAAEIFTSEPVPQGDTMQSPLDRYPAQRAMPEILSPPVGRLAFQRKEAMVIA